MKRLSISIPSLVESPSDHHNWERALKSPLKKVAKGFSAWIFECKCLKFVKKALNSGVLCLEAGLRYNTEKNIFLRPSFNSITTDSSKGRSFRTIAGRVFLKNRPTPPCLLRRFRRNEVKTETEFLYDSRRRLFMHFARLERAHYACACTDVRVSLSQCVHSVLTQLRERTPKILRNKQTKKDI